MTCHSPLNSIGRSLAAGTGRNRDKWACKPCRDEKWRDMASAVRHEGGERHQTNLKFYQHEAAHRPPTPPTVSNPAARKAVRGLLWDLLHDFGTLKFWPMSKQASSLKVIPGLTGTRSLTTSMAISRHRMIRPPSPLWFQAYKIGWLKMTKTPSRMRKWKSDLTKVIRAYREHRRKLKVSLLTSIPEGLADSRINNQINPSIPEIQEFAIVVVMFPKTRIGFPGQIKK